jgi:serine/threonine-protein kinase PknK
MRAAAVTRLGLAALHIGLVAAAAGCDGDAGEPDGAGTILTVGPGRWEPLPPMPLPARSYAGVAAARGKIFVVGGAPTPDEPRPAAEVMRLVHAFDPAAGTWEELPPLPAAVPMVNAAGVGDRLFVLGGAQSTMTLEYDFSARAWQPRAPVPLPRGRGNSTIGVHGTSVLLAGGVLSGLSPNMLATGERTQDLLAYDSKRDTWDTLPPAPVALGYAMGAVVDDQFFVMGGSYVARTDEVLIYDLKARTWAPGKPLPTTLSSAAAGVIGGKIVIAGGIASTTGMISPNTLLLDPTRPDAGWTTITPITTPRFAVGGAVVGNKMYVPTGVGVGPNGQLDFRALPNLEVFFPQ